MDHRLAKDPVLTCSRTLGQDRGADCTPNRIKVLALSAENSETVTLEGLANVVALKILRWVAGDGDIVVVDDQFDVEALGDGKAGSLGIITLLLRAIGAKAEYNLVRVGEGDTVDHWPEMTKTPRGELDTRRQTEFWVTRQLRVSLAVVQELLSREVAMKGGEKILRGDTVAYKSRSIGVVMCSVATIETRLDARLITQ